MPGLQQHLKLAGKKLFQRRSSAPLLSAATRHRRRASGSSENDVLALGAGLERGSEHPLAAAVLSGAAERRMTPVGIDDFSSATGQGMTGDAGRRRIALGNRT